MISASYWRTGEGQTIVLGIIFFLVFLAYFIVQGFTAILFGPELGANVLVTLYAAFTIFCFISPSIVNRVGPRLTLFVGVLSYGVLVLSALCLLVDAAGSWVVLLGGVINGAGSALTWTAQGRLMLAYADGERASGRVFQLFWSLFMSSAVTAGLVTFAYFSTSSSKGNAPLFLFFLLVILLAAAGTGFLIPPETVVRSTSVEEPDSASSADTKQGRCGPDSGVYHSAPTVSPLIHEDGMNLGDDDEQYDCEEESVLDAAAEAPPTTLHDVDFQPGGWFHEVRETALIARDRRMVRSTLLFFYIGLNQPYQVIYIKDYLLWVLLPFQLLMLRATGRDVWKSFLFTFHSGSYICRILWR